MSAVTMRRAQRLPVRPLLTLAGLAIVALVPLALGPSQLNLAVMICIDVVAVVGLSLLFGYTGQISLAQAQLMGMGAYTSAILTTKAGFPIWAAFICSGLVPGAIAYAIGRPILRLRGYYLAMATVAVGGIIVTLIQQLRGLTGGFDGIVGIPSPSIGGFRLDEPLHFYYAALVCALLAVLFAWNITRSRIGRAMRALRDTEQGAASVGVDVAALKSAIFALSAALAGLAGSLYAHYALFVSPETFTLSQSVTFVLILSIGGLGSIGGAVIGAALLTLLPEWLRSFGRYDNVIYGAVVVVIMVVMPGGVWGGLTRLWALVRQRLTPGAAR
jgi:branched-chain amino acid transport system permease protein